MIFPFLQYKGIQYTACDMELFNMLHMNVIKEGIVKLFHRDCSTYFRKLQRKNTAYRDGIANRERNIYIQKKERKKGFFK